MTWENYCHWIRLAPKSNDLMCDKLKSWRVPELFLKKNFPAE